MKFSKRGRALALILTLLMVVSTFAVLPAAAEEQSTTNVLWGYDFSTFGAIVNNSTDASVATIRPNTATGATYPNGYLVDRDIFHVDGTKSTGTAWGVTGQPAITQPGGMMNIGGNACILPADASAHPNSSAFFNLMYGLEDGHTSYFMEMDFLQKKAPDVRTDSSSSWTVNGVTSTGALFTADDANSGTFFRFWSGSQAEGLFRVAPDPSNGDYARIYTFDNVTSDEREMVANGSVYYMNGEEKVYLTADATIDTGKTNLGYAIKDPAKAVRIEIGTTYRIGVAFEVLGTTSVTNGGSTYTVTNMKATVYMKAAEAPYWETCVGSTEYSYYPVGSTNNATTYKDVIFLNEGSSLMSIGGDWTIYESKCDGVAHPNIIKKPSASDPTRYTCECMDCGATWQVRDIDGVLYKGEEIGTVCEGSYVIWTPMQGIGLPFAETVYSTVGAGHSYDAYGECTVCGEYEYVTEIPDGFYMSGNADSKTNVADSSGNTRYDSSRGDMKIEKSGPVYMNGDMNKPFGASYQPFTVSFDLDLMSCDWNVSKFGAFAELLTLHAGDSTRQDVLQIGMDGENRPFLCFPVDFRTSSTETKQTVDIALVDGVEDVNDANYETLEQYKDYYGRDCGGKAWIYSDNGSTRTYTFYNHNVGSYYLTADEWVNVSLTVIPDSSTNKASLTLYVNGDLVASRPNYIAWNTAFYGVRFNPGAGRYTLPVYYLDNLGLRFHDTVGEAYTDKMASTDVFSYRFDRFQTNLWDANFQIKYLGGDFFTTTSPLMMGYWNDAFANKAVAGSIAHYNNPSVKSSDRISVALSSKVADAFTHLSDDKYEINVTLALDEATKDDSVYNLVRLSKYYDSYVKVSLVYLGANGYLGVVNGEQVALVDLAGENLSPYTTVVDGVPTDLSNLRTVVDEINNTYSIYVDGSIAYYEQDGTCVPFKNIMISGLEGKGVDENDGSYLTYHDYTRAFAQELVAAGTVSGKNLDTEYVCLLQGMSDFYLEDITVKAIPDSAVEYVGVQERKNEGSFDLRFIAAIDDVYVDAVGFRIDAYYNDEFVGQQSVTSNDVFREISADGSAFGAYETDKGTYLTAVKIVNIEETGITNTYTFKITPYAVNAKGEPEVFFETHTVVYNGAGQCLNNGFPFEEVDPEDYEGQVSPAVMLEMTPKVNEDYGTFYAYVRTSDPSGRYYVRYNFAYLYSTEVENNTDNTCININSFRIKGATLVKVSGISDTAVTCQAISDVLDGGEVSLAVKEDRTGVQDFIGGFHGDEHIKSFSLKADGVSYTADTERVVIPCSQLVVEQTTQIDRWEEGLGEDGKKEQAMEHKQVFTVDGNGISIDRTVTWLVDDFKIASAFPTMLTMRRVVNPNAAALQPVCEIVELYDGNGNQLSRVTTELSYPDTTTKLPELKNVDTREVRYSSATTGFSAVAGVKDLSDTVIPDNVYVACRTADNKFYFGVNTGKTPAEGEVWSLTQYFHIDYVAPAN